ncbi:MAG: TcfC E-set like domain-containing protein [Gammaproteobacteria bacterium]|nr:TcfC E-set like domain-containing protein [Gammaproteobacteria bacterium]
MKFSFAAGNNDSLLIVTNTIPPGFEDLAGPQTNQIDVYLHNKLIISTMATYDAETLTLKNPEAVIDKIQDLHDPSVILKSLSRTLNTNSDKLCLQHIQSDSCGELEPNIIGIIFDEGQFRMDLFINPLQLKAVSVYQSKYLPKPVDQFSTLHALNINLSGTDEINDSYNIQTNSIIAFGETRLSAQSNYTNKEDFVIDDMSLISDQPGWEAEAGIFDTETRASNFFPTEDIIGLRARSSTNTRTDLEVTEGTQIFIFLNQRSRVEVFKNNRLIDARFYDAGNRQLDTSRFPNGAYRISVRIRDDNNSERTEEYFYVRNSLLPSMDEPQYFIEAGSVAEIEQDSVFPESSSNYVIHTGGMIRVKENLAVEAEIASTSNESIVQAGIVHIAAGIQSQVNVMTTTESDWGISVRENWATERFSLNLDLRFIHEGNENHDLDKLDFVSNDFTQASASFTHSLFGGRMLWRYGQTDRGFSEKSETYSLDYNRSIYRKNKLNVDWSFDASKDSDDYLIGTRLNFNLRKNNDTYQVSTGYESRKTNNMEDNDAIGRASWQHNARSPTYGNLQSRLFHINETTISTTGMNITSDSRYGYNQVEIDNTKEDGRNTLGYAVRSQFNLASDFQHVSLGGSGYNTSAVIIDLIGQPEGSKFEVYIDRQSAGFAKIGAKTVIPLTPYKTYDIRLVSRTDSFVTFDESVKQVTLYPGNVETLTYDIKRVSIIIGQVLRPDGSPFDNARIENVTSFSGTDQNGWFQLETGKVDSLTFNKKSSGEKCTVKLNDYTDNEDVHVFNQIVCTTIENSIEYSPTQERT